MPKEKIYYLNNNDEVINKIKEIAKPKDIILLKASNGMKFFDIAEKLKTEIYKKGEWEKCKK